MITMSQAQKDIGIIVLTENQERQADIQNTIQIKRKENQKAQRNQERQNIQKSIPIKDQEDADNNSFSDYICNYKV